MDSLCWVVELTRYAVVGWSSPPTFRRPCTLPARGAALALPEAW
jgi:hypothetical protein